MKISILFEPITGLKIPSCVASGGFIVKQIVFRWDIATFWSLTVNLAPKLPLNSDKLPVILADSVFAAAPVASSAADSKFDAWLATGEKCVAADNDDEAPTTSDDNVSAFMFAGSFDGVVCPDTFVNPLIIILLNN